MNSKILKWALPAFALTAVTGQSVEARIPGKTSYGARAGYDNMSLNAKGIINGTTITAGNFPNGIKNFGSNYGGAAGGFFVSHDVQLDRGLCFGVEGYVGASNTDSGRLTHNFGDAAPTIAYTNVKKDYTFGGRLKLGHYVCHDVLLYASVGVENTRYKLDHSYASTIGAFGGGDVANGSNSSHSLWGWVPGVGVKWKLRGNWCCQIDATYAMYDGLSKEVSGSTNTAQYTYNFNMRPTVFGLTVGFVRPF